MGSSHGKLSEEDRNYIVQSTNLPPKQVDKVFKTFLKRHPDRKIRKEDFSKELSTWYNFKDFSTMENTVFEAFDTNNDGVIDFKEYMIVFYILSYGTPEQKMMQIFRLCDLDKDGTVSKYELKYVLLQVLYL